MSKTVYKSFEELPMFLNVSTVAKLFGISQSSGYELVKSKDFPSIKIGCRIVIPKDKLKEWLDNKMAV